jgi:hypothetical protein
MKVSWDDEIPNIWTNKIHVPNHQPDYQMESAKSSVNFGVLQLLQSAQVKVCRQAQD